MRTDEEMTTNVQSRVQSAVRQKKSRVRRTAAALLVLALVLSAFGAVKLGRVRVIRAGIGQGYAYPATEALKNREKIGRIADGSDDYYRRLADSGFLVRDVEIDDTAKNGKFRLILTAENTMNAAAENGWFVLLDGVVQSIRLRFADGSVTDAAALQPVLFDAKETKTITVEFTPNVGKKGETLSLQLGQMLYPSYVADYYGEEFGYGFMGENGVFLPHRISTEDLGEITLQKDAPRAMTAADVRVTSVTPDETALTAFFGRETPAAGLGDDCRSMLSLSPADEIRARNVNVLPSENGKLVLSVLGPARDYRATLFVDHTPVDLGGTTFVDFTAKRGEVTTVELSIPDLEAAVHHVWALLEWREGEHLFTHKLPTEFLFVGQAPEAKPMPEKAPAPQLPAGDVRWLGVESGDTLLYTSYLENGKLAVVTLRGEVKWTAPLDLTIYDPSTGETVSAELSKFSEIWSVVGNRVIAVDNPASGAPHIVVFDDNAEIVSDVPYDPDLPDSAAAKRDLRYEYQNSDFNLMISEDGTKALYFRSGRYGGDWKTWVIDVYTGEKTLVGSAVNGTQGEIAEMSGMLKQGEYGIVKGMLGENFLAENYNANDEYIAFSHVDAEGKTVAGPVRVEGASFILSGRGRYRVLTPHVNAPSAAGNLSDVCYVLDASSLAVAAVRVEGSDKGMTDCAVSADGKVLVAHDRENSILRVYAVDTGEELLAVGEISAFLHDAVCSVDTARRTVCLRADAPVPQEADGRVPQDIALIAY